MIRRFWRLGVALLFIFSAVAVNGSAAMADDATVKITDQGFDPPNISINRGGTITWTNTGTKVHTATTKLGPVAFDTGGIGNGQAFPINFTLAGTYTYTSSIDCPGSGSFNCGVMGVVSVVDATQAYNPNAFNMPPPPTPTPVLPGPQQNVVIHITSHGFDPAQATVALGGSVTFINDDQGGTHNALTVGGGPQPFDTGGLTPGLLFSIGFNIQGTYNYTSAVDCLHGNSRPGFDCSTAQITVSPQPSALAPAPSNAVVAASSGTGTNIAIDEAQGYSPKVLVINAGDTVTWTNSGKKVHTVVSDPGYTPAFNSGGLDPSKAFSVKFSTAGSYNYHSTTEANYALDTFGHLVPQWGMTGTIIVQ